MKKRNLRRGAALALACCLCPVLAGCEAMLERSYSASTVHMDRPSTAEDPSILRVEDYRELVSAVLYLVSQGEEEGVIQLHNYSGEVESDLTSACLEVATEDPLGAYCVDYIKHECSRVVSYYQATLNIHYRRTQEQVRSIVNVTGTSAIRTELREALAAFETEVVLRVAYFAEDAESIAELIRQAYYDAPATALGMPGMEISLYPDSGRERVLEILLTYPDSAEDLRRESEELALRVGEAINPFIKWGDRQAALEAAEVLRETAVYEPDGEDTPYAALVQGEADSEGMALAYALLCRQAGVNCEVVKGTRAGEDRFWNQLSFPGGETLYMDAADPEAELRTAEEMAVETFWWPGAPELPQPEPETAALDEVEPPAEDGGEAPEETPPGEEPLDVPEETGGEGS